MQIPVATTLAKLMGAVIGQDAANALIDLVDIDPAIGAGTGDQVRREVIAQALNLLLLEDLLARVPTGAAYVADLAKAGRRLVFDHGAVRTVGLSGMGALPAGEAALTRVLKPLGYARAETYPLDRLGMTGRSYAHVDYPETLPQFFVSELHVERFSLRFQEAARRVTARSEDPLSPGDTAKLEILEAEGQLGFEAARTLLPRLVACFGRQHVDAAWSDYEILLSESAEMAWIATEGNAFNHATDRVVSIGWAVARERSLGRPLKPTVEVSTNGRIWQTAFLADPVQRTFVGPDGGLLARGVPGSFFEFIQREIDPDTGRLDLSFDSSNAQGIFKMTSARQA